MSTLMTSQEFVLSYLYEDSHCYLILTLGESLGHIERSLINVALSLLKYQTISFFVSQ